MCSADVIAFQGEAGAYSHQAVVELYGENAALPCPTFEMAIAAVQDGRATKAVLPIENSTYGRVPDFHRLLPESNLKISGEHFVRVHISLLAIPGTKLEEIKTVRSHSVLLGQCRQFLTKHQIMPIAASDTAGSAKEIARLNDPSQGALASPLAGKIYGLARLVDEIEDQAHNTTRFLVLSKESEACRDAGKNVITSLVFRVRNLPAALFKALGGFATNGVNMIKLESYMLDDSFRATQFYAEVVGHPDDEALKNSLNELAFYTERLDILGSYKMSSYRDKT